MTSLIIGDATLYAFQTFDEFCSCAGDECGEKGSQAVRLKTLSHECTKRALSYQPGEAWHLCVLWSRLHLLLSTNSIWICRPALCLGCLSWCCTQNLILDSLVWAALWTSVLWSSRKYVCIIQQIRCAQLVVLQRWKILEDPSHLADFSESFSAGLEVLRRLVVYRPFLITVLYHAIVSFIAPFPEELECCGVVAPE